jgi:hypothetical protein
MDTNETDPVIEARRATCDRCGSDGIVVDTTAGEIVGTDGVPIRAAPADDLWLMADEAGDPICDACDCGIGALRVEAAIADDPDTVALCAIALGEPIDDLPEWIRLGARPETLSKTRAEARASVLATIRTAREES